MAASLFTNIDYSCVPVTRVVPTTPPDSGTGPFLVDCDDGNLWVWACTEERWVKITGAIDFNSRTPWGTIASNVTNACDQVYLEAYCVDNTDNSLKPTRLTTNEFGTILKSCQGFLSAGEIDARIVALGNDLRIALADVASQSGPFITFSGVGGGSCIQGTMSLDPGYLVCGTSQGGGIIYGEGTIIQGGVNKGVYTVTNPFNTRALLQLDIDYQITMTYNQSANGGITSIGALTTNPNLSYEEVFSDEPALTTDAKNICVINLVHMNRVYVPDTGLYIFGDRGQLAQAVQVLEPNETVTYYFDHWETITAMPEFLYHTKAYARGIVFGNYRGA